MTKSIELIFDFVSPNAYLVWQPLRALAARQGAQVHITPAFLGGMHKLTGNAPPFIRDAEVNGNCLTYHADRDQPAEKAAVNTALATLGVIVR